LHLSRWTNLFVAPISEITAFIGVRLSAFTICTKCVGCVDFVNVLLGACVGVAMTFFHAAYVVVGFCTSVSLAEEIPSIMSVLEAWRASECVAVLLTGATCQSLILRTRCALAFDLFSKSLLDKTCWAIKCTASACYITASVPVNRCATGS
jgi:hypothetical protein